VPRISACHPVSKQANRTYATLDRYKVYPHGWSNQRWQLISDPLDSAYGVDSISRCIEGEVPTWRRAAELGILYAVRGMQVCSVLHGACCAVHGAAPVQLKAST
jgi:hypothetical protein